MGVGWFDVALARVLRLSSSGSILCYHGVTRATGISPSIIHVSVEELGDTIDALQQVGRVVPLRDLIRLHQAGSSTAGLVSLTFDDGYVSLLEAATELIHARQIPVTVFVVGSAAESGARFWWDRVDDVFPRVEPERWSRFELASGLPETYRAGQPRDGGPLRPLRQWILAKYQGRWPAHLQDALTELEHETGVQTQQRSMTYEEIERFASVPWVDVGVHTWSHAVLPLLDDNGIREEIQRSHSALRERLGQVMPVLSVPFGLFDARTLRLAQESGMSASLTLGGTTLNMRHSSHGLPRFVVVRGMKPRKILARTAGLAERLLRTEYQRYPELPSPTT